MKCKCIYQNKATLPCSYYTAQQTCPRCFWGGTWKRHRSGAAGTYVWSCDSTFSWGLRQQQLKSARPASPPAFLACCLAISIFHTPSLPPPLYLQVHLSCPRFSFLIPLSLKFQIESIFSLKLVNTTLSVLKSVLKSLLNNPEAKIFWILAILCILILLSACHKFQRPNPFASRVFENIFQVFPGFNCCF